MTNLFRGGEEELVKLENRCFKIHLPLNYFQRSFKREPTWWFQHRTELEGELPTAQSVASHRNALISK